MKINYLQRLIYPTTVLASLIFAIGLIVYGTTQFDWHDFDVFYYAARSALEGGTIYIIIGQYDLPFWYFPWAAWFFIPFAIFPHNIGLLFYKILSLLSAVFVLVKLKRHYAPGFQNLDVLFIFALLTPMSVQLMQVGQMDYIFLALAVAIIFAVEQKRGVLAGFLLPFLWIKPHLVIIFTLFVFLHARKRTVIVSIFFTLSMFLLQTLIHPGWHLEMLDLLQAGSQRIDGLRFTTMPSMLGFQENWVGTGNLPFTALLILIALGAVWHVRALPTVPLLSFALAASLFCAPRAYAYDLPLIIPAMMWLTHENFRRTLWLWVAAAAIPFLSGFDSISYLVILIVFIFSAYKAKLSTT